MVRGKLQQRRLSGIAGGAATSVRVARALGVVAMNDGVEQGTPAFRFGSGDEAIPGEQTAFSRFDDEVVHVEPVEPHPVFRQCPGLVGADHGGAPQCLNGREVFDERFARGHALAAHGEGQGDGGQKPFGHIGDDDADAENRARPESQSHPDADGEEDQTHQQ